MNVVTTPLPVNKDRLKMTTKVYMSAQTHWYTSIISGLTLKFLGKRYRTRNVAIGFLFLRQQQVVLKESNEQPAGNDTLSPCPPCRPVNLSTCQACRPCLLVNPSTCQPVDLVNPVDHFHLIDLSNLSSCLLHPTPFNLLSTRTSISD